MNKEDVENFKALATAFADGATASRYKSTRWYQVYNKKFAELIYEAGKSDAQRKWVGLTDEEVNQLYTQIQEQVDKHWVDGGTSMMFPTTLYKAIEDKLKDKNT